MPANEIFSVSTDSTSLFFASGEIKTKESDSSNGYGIRALVKGRLGFAYCQKESEIPDALVHAGRMSRFSVESGFAFGSRAKTPEADILDPSLSPDDTPALRALLDEARDGAESLGGKSRVMLDAARSRLSIRNTEGMDCAYGKTSFSVYVECMHDDGFGTSYLGSCKKPGSIRSAGTEAAQMAADMRGAKKPEGGSYTVVMEPEALMSVLDILLPSFSGDWKRRGITKLAEGGSVFSDKLTICEDALSAGTEARPFDDEGTPSRKRFLVRDGRVESFLYDRETAALAGIPKESLGDYCGACTRPDYDRPPSISSSNLVVSPGEWSDFGGLGKHIELHYAHGSHTANPTSGDIGLEASSAFMVEGKSRKPIKGFMLTGNIFDMFREIEAIEEEQKVFGSLISPRIAFKGLRVVV